MKKVVKNVCACLSVLVFIIVIVEWIRGRSHWDMVAVRVTHYAVKFNSEPGRIGLELFIHPPSPSDRWMPDLFGSSEIILSSSKLWIDVLLSKGFGWQFLGIGYAYQITGQQSTRIFFFPHWLAATLLLIYPMFHYIRLWQQRMLNYPTCTKCGYNLTGNVSGVCPECGEKI